MESLSAGTFVGSGSFRCQRCGYALTLEGSDVLTACPSCGGQQFLRASLFSTERISKGEGEPTEARLVQAPPPDLGERLEQARAQIDKPGEYLVYEESGDLLTVSLSREWTRIGRSLAADLRFDDPTVSRRHALIVRHPDGVRLLDDRSLNGVFVNGARIDGRLLQDGDEIIVGRYRLSFLRVGSEASVSPPAGSGPVSSVG
jgi:pSer/pThr/pTyr-binding forkhead associated (FHA) protein/DNA-directed RNA polymerase subunit RPC12/RpoP